MHLRLTALLAVLMALPLPMLANTTYTYTGNDFDSITGSLYSTSDFITGSFTVATPLAPNSGGPVHPISFSFSDGVVSVDQDHNQNSEFVIQADANGNILVWFIELTTSGGGGFINTINTGVGGERIDNGQQADGESGLLIGNPGTWTESTSPVPEPSTLTLAGTGVLAMAGAIRRKFRS